ncbi:MAG: carbon starvation CstA 5TM domain-containing protein [Haloarculaceae archaeon]
MVVAETSTTRVSRALTNKYLTGGVQSFLAYLLVASGSWATVWPLFGASVQVFAGLSMLTLAVWIVNWDASKQGAGFLLGAGFILAASLSALL